MIALLFFRT